MRLPLAVALSVVCAGCAIQFPAVATRYHTMPTEVCHLGCDWDVHLTTVRGWGPFIGAHFAAHPHGGRSRLSRASVSTGILLRSKTLLPALAIELGGEAGIGHPDPNASPRSSLYLGAVSQLLYRLYGDADRRPAASIVLFAVDAVVSGRVGGWSLPEGHEDLELGAAVGLRFTIGSDLFEEEFMRGAL